MKPTTKMSRATAQLEQMFKKLNEDLFEGALPTPMLYFRDRAQNRTSCKEKWDVKGFGSYEIALSSDKIALPVEELAGELVHEMVHLYCFVNGLKDTSRNGCYHNNRYREVAENYGLICVQDEKRGWITSPSDELVGYVCDQGWSEIQITHSEEAVNDAAVRRAQAKTKVFYMYGCPDCGPRMQASRNVGYLCSCGKKLKRLCPVAAATGNM